MSIVNNDLSIPYDVNLPTPYNYSVKQLLGLLHNILRLILSSFYHA
jgi:hypothetical protein